MIDDKTTATTLEICALAGFTKQRLHALENQNIVQRSARDTWPLVRTITALFDDARARAEVHSAADNEWQRARAQREQLKLKRELREVCYTRDFDALVDQLAGAYLAEYASVPAQCTADARLRELVNTQQLFVVRTVIEEAQRAAQTRVADKMGALARELHGKDLMEKTP